MVTRTRSRGCRAAGISTLAVVALFAAACGSDEPATTPADTSSEVPVTDSPLPPGTDPDDGDDTADDGSTDVPASLQPMVDLAVADLVARRGLAGADDVEVVSVEEVTWRDRGLGCPRKDMQYAQVLTDGTRIVLATGGYSYHYHAGHGQDPFYCPNPEPAVGE